jgi:thiol:disulfide interchange protein DsbG
MLKKNILAVAVATVALTSFGANVAFAATAAAPTAASAPAEYTGPLPAVLQAASKQGGMLVVKKFDAKGGLVGWVVQENASKKYVVVYSTQDGTVLLAGMALDAQGQNLTGEYMKEYAPQVDYSPAYKAFQAAASVEWGNAPASAPEVTIVSDPNCPFCQLVERMVKPAVDDGKLRVRLVPVAILGHDSPQKAAGMLAAKDLEAYMNADIISGEFGSGVPESTDGTLEAKVATNTGLMRTYGFGGTPAVMYMSGRKGAQTLTVSPGVPNMAELFTKLGLPEYIDKLKADPQYARYVGGQ